MPFLAYRKGKAFELSYDLILNDFDNNENQINYERFINSEEDSELILGLEVNYLNGSGKMRHELWKCNHNIVFIKYSNTGYREFKYYNNDQLDKVKDIINEEKETMTVYGQGVYEYMSIQDRKK